MVSDAEHAQAAAQNTECIHLSYSIYINNYGSECIYIGYRAKIPPHLNRNYQCKCWSFYERYICMPYLPTKVRGQCDALHFLASLP